MTTLFNRKQVNEMTNNMNLACLFIDVNNKKEVLNSIFCGVAFSGVNITQEMKEQALSFAKTFA